MTASPRLTGIEVAETREKARTRRQKGWMRRAANIVRVVRRDGGEVGWREETGDRGDEKGEGEESLEDEVEVTRELRDCGRAGEVKNKS